MAREIDKIMIDQPAFAVGQMEGPDLILGTDDTLDFVRYDPDRNFVDIYHESTPYSFATQEDLNAVDDDDTGEQGKE